VIAGIGIEQVLVSDPAGKLTDQPETLKLLFTTDEIAYCRSQKRSEQSFAARLAAKKAFCKAAGLSAESINLAEIEVTRDSQGSPSLKLHGHVRGVIEQRKITNIRVSLSHESDLAAAVVALES
jgi:holo-[acyl-carrier protein] synthase